MKSQTSKVLFRICGRELIGLVVDAAADAGLNPIVAVVSPQDSQVIRDTLGQGVVCVEQTRPLGTWHALLQAKSALKGLKSVVVLCGDVPLIRPATIKRLVELHDNKEACITLLTSTVADPKGLGRIIRSPSGLITAVVEEQDADKNTLLIPEINSGVYCFRSSWLWDNLEPLPTPKDGEILLTDLVAIAVNQGMSIESIEPEDPTEASGVNDRVQLAEAETSLQERIRQRWMRDGVSMPDPSSVYIDCSAQLGRDTVILPNSHITGNSQVGRDCEIGPNSIIHDSIVGNECRIVASVIEGSTLESGVDAGPFSHVRPGSHLEDRSYVGNYAEIKNSRLGRGSKSGHFSFIGDADVGANVNIGAGTVTCNYDGHRKNPTIIEDGAFIGCDSMLVAPITIGARSWTGAGSVVTEDVPSDSIAIGVPAKVTPKKDCKASSTK